MNKVLVVAVHPDDETLGCGGTLLKHKDAGDEIHWLIATEIVKSKDVSKRDNEINNVEGLYNFNSVHRLGFATTKVDEYGISELISRISFVVNSIKPNIIYLPFTGDVHSDHKYIFEAAYSCTKSFRYPFVKKIYMMETLSETEFSVNVNNESFVPNVFVNISDYINKKIEAMKMYEGEMGSHPFPRSERNIKALATYRGATAGCEYAESFMLIKEVG
jgi:LmbE family N-acetylglucosaminyl deacetylase